jgi:hypothetical protein
MARSLVATTALEEQTMSAQQPQYRPGTVVNGHVLTEDGQWVPVHPSHPGQPLQPQRKKMSGWAN